VKALVIKINRTAIHEEANMLGISFELVHNILRDYVKMYMPSLLTVEQMEKHVSMCKDLQGKSERPKLLSKAITGDVTWFLGMNKKPSNSCLSVPAHHVYNQERQDMFTQIWACAECFFFSHSHNCALRNLFHKDRL
jgi:hypothetical protein